MQVQFTFHNEALSYEYLRLNKYRAIRTACKSLSQTKQSKLINNLNGTLVIFLRNEITDFQCPALWMAIQRDTTHNSILLPATNLHYAQYTRGSPALPAHRNDIAIFLLFTVSNNINIMVYWFYDVWLIVGHNILYYRVVSNMAWLVFYLNISLRFIENGVNGH